MDTEAIYGPRDTNIVLGLIDMIRISNWCLTFVPHFESPLTRDTIWIQRLNMNQGIQI